MKQKIIAAIIIVIVGSFIIKNPDKASETVNNTGGQAGDAANGLTEFISGLDGNLLGIVIIIGVVVWLLKR